MQHRGMVPLSCAWQESRLVALLPPEMVARATAAAGIVLHPGVTQKGCPFCSSSQSQELRDTEIQRATHAKALMSSAGLRLAAGPKPTSLLPQGYGQRVVHHPTATCSLFASPSTLSGALVCPPVCHSSDATKTMPGTPAHIKLFLPLPPRQLKHPLEVS